MNSVFAIGRIINSKLKVRSDFVPALKAFAKEAEGREVHLEYSIRIDPQSDELKYKIYYKDTVLPTVHELLVKSGVKLANIDDTDFYLRYMFMRREVETEYGKVILARTFESCSKDDQMNILGSVAIWTVKTFKTSLPRIK